MTIREVRAHFYSTERCAKEDALRYFYYWHHKLTPMLSGTRGTLSSMAEMEIA